MNQQTQHNQITHYIRQLERHLRHLPKRYNRPVAAFVAYADRVACAIRDGGDYRADYSGMLRAAHDLRVALGQ